MRLKAVITFCLLMTLCGMLSAQYIPHTGQPFQFAPVYNPAFTGIENFVDVKLGHRYQWAAFGSSAPQFSNLAVNFRTKQPLDLKVNALRPSRTNFTQIVPRSKLSYHGLGFNVFNEKIGPLAEFGLGVHYAVHIPVSEKIMMAAGAGAMYERAQLKGGDELYWGENVDVNDPIYKKLEAGSINQASLWTRAGILVYSDNFYIGATYYPWNTTVGTPAVEFTEQFYSGTFQAGVSFPLNEDIDIKPSVLALWQTDNQFVIDYQVKCYLQDKTWFGLTYRDIQAGVVTGGFNFNTMFTASYSYEFSLGKLRTFSGSTHELVLAARLKNYKKVNQRVW